MMGLLCHLDSISVIQCLVMETYIVHGALLPLATHLNKTSI